MRVFWIVHFTQHSLGYSQQALMATFAFSLIEQVMLNPWMGKSITY